MSSEEPPDPFSDPWAKRIRRQGRVAARREAHRMRQDLLLQEEARVLAEAADFLMLRIRFRDGGSDRAPTADDIVQDIEAGQQIVTYAAFLGSLGPGVFEGAGPSLAADIATTNLLRARERGRDAPVLQMTLNSPLEVLLWIGGATTALSLSANRIIDTFNRVQEARQNKSDADLHVAQNEFIQEQIADVKAAAYPMAQPHVEQLVEDTSFALTRVESIELLGAVEGTGEEN